MRSHHCWVKLLGDESDLLLQQSLAYPVFRNGHLPPWTSPSHHSPGCKQLLVQWPEHTKLLLGTLPLHMLLLNPRMPFPTLFCPPPHPAIVIHPSKASSDIITTRTFSCLFQPSFPHHHYPWTLQNAFLPCHNYMFTCLSPPYPQTCCCKISSLFTSTLSRPPCRRSRQHLAIWPGKASSRGLVLRYYKEAELRSITPQRKHLTQEQKLQEVPAVSAPVPDQTRGVLRSLNHPHHLPKLSAPQPPLRTQTLPGRP